MPSDGREWEQGLFVHQVLAWAKQHQQRLAGALAGLIAKQELLEALLAWLQWAETTLSDRDKEVLPQEIEEVKALIAEHQVTDVTPARLLRPSQEKAVCSCPLPQPLPAVPDSSPALELLSLCWGLLPFPDALSSWPHQGAPLGWALPPATPCSLGGRLSLHFVPRSAPPLLHPHSYLTSLVHWSMFASSAVCSQHLTRSPPVLQTHLISVGTHGLTQKSVRFGSDGHHADLLFAHSFL